MESLKLYLEKYNYPWAIVGSSALKYWAEKVGRGGEIRPNDIDILIDGDKYSAKELATGWTEMKGISSGMKNFKSVYESVDGNYDFIRNSFKINLENKTEGFLNLPELFKFYKTVYDEEDEATQLKIAPKLEILKELIEKDGKDWNDFIEMLTHPAMSEEDILW